jgi:hypothetical protein
MDSESVYESDVELLLPCAFALLKWGCLLVSAAKEARSSRRVVLFR